MTMRPDTPRSHCSNKVPRAGASSSVLLVSDCEACPPAKAAMMCRFARRGGYERIWRTHPWIRSGSAPVRGFVDPWSSSCWVSLSQPAHRDQMPGLDLSEEHKREIHFSTLPKSQRRYDLEISIPWCPGHDSACPGEHGSASRTSTLRAPRLGRSCVAL